MIYSLRQRHRRMMMALAILLPVLFLAGLLVRRAFPVNSTWPVTLPSAPPSPGGMRP